MRRRSFLGFLLASVPAAASGNPAFRVADDFQALRTANNCHFSKIGVEAEERLLRSLIEDIASTPIEDTDSARPESEESWDD